MTSRAFLIEHVKNLDVTDAEEYGRIEILFPAHGMRSSMWEPSYIDDLHDRLEDYEFDPDNDFLVVAGNQGLVNISLAEMVGVYGRVHCLLWDASARSYVPMWLGAKDDRQCQANVSQST